jgi:hypothetical protein
MCADSTTNLDERLLQIREAYQRVADAYVAARLDVFDVYPEGTPPDHELTRRQSDRLLELRLAELELTKARKLEHPSSSG